MANKEYAAPKVDVGVQAYRKPESLIYTLMTLKEHSSDRIERVYINDDKSGDGSISLYTNPAVVDYFRPWRLVVRENRRAIRWPVAFVLGYRPKYLGWKYFLKYSYRNLRDGRALFYDRQDIRYQWALETTDKAYLYLIHDDIEFRSDVLGRYLAAAADMKRPGIIGDLGQCWRCGHADGEDPCSPERIAAGWRPSPSWPLTKPGKGGHGRDCHINEWSCLISTEAARAVLEKERCFFGNYDDYGDVGAYWFERALSMGFSFHDPIPSHLERTRWYCHGWQGFAGHSVWAAQDGIRNAYDRSLVLARIRERYGFDLSELLSHER